MGVQHAMDIRAGLVHGAVDNEAGRVDGEGRVDHLVAMLVHFHQRRRGDLVVHQPVRVDQEVVLGTGSPRADVREHEVAPAIQGDQPIAGRKVHAQLPFIGADELFERGDLHDGREDTAHSRDALDCAGRTTMPPMLSKR
jgi:hypothetical protein